MRILVTGANGYIGSKVVKNLCDLNFDVIATDFSNSNIDLRAKYIKANIFEDKQNWLEFFDNPDVCLHLAWRDGFVHNSSKHMGDLSYHYNFLTNLVDNGLKQLCVMGTMHEVGYWEGKVDENTPCKPLSMYGIAKNSLRQSMELYLKNKSCLLQWFRAFYIYGDDLYGNSIFCKIKRAATNGDKLFPFTTGQNKYDFINIDDLCFQIVKAISQNKILGIINLCSGEPKKLSDMIEWYILHNNLDIKLDYGKYPDRVYDSPCIYGDSKKINAILKEGE